MRQAPSFHNLFLINCQPNSNCRSDSWHTGLAAWLSPLRWSYSANQIRRESRQISSAKLWSPPWIRQFRIRCVWFAERKEDGTTVYILNSRRHECWIYFRLGTHIQHRQSVNILNILSTLILIIEFQIKYKTNSLNLYKTIKLRDEIFLHSEKKMHTQKIYKFVFTIYSQRKQIKSRIIDLLKHWWWYILVSNISTSIVVFLHFFVPENAYHRPNVLRTVPYLYVIGLCRVCLFQKMYTTHAHI